MTKSDYNIDIKLVFRTCVCNTRTLIFMQRYITKIYRFYHWCSRTQCAPPYSDAVCGGTVNPIKYSRGFVLFCDGYLADLWDVLTHFFQDCFTGPGNDIIDPVWTQILSHGNRDCLLWWTDSDFLHLTHTHQLWQTTEWRRCRCIFLTTSRFRTCMRAAASIAHDILASISSLVISECLFSQWEDDSVQCVCLTAKEYRIHSLKRTNFQWPGVSMNALVAVTWDSFYHDNVIKWKHFPRYLVTGPLYGEFTGHRVKTIVRLVIWHAITLIMMSL